MSLKDVVLAISIMALWGLHFVIIRIGALEIPPFLLLSLRFALCALIFLPFANRLSKSQLKNLFFYALPMYALHMSTLFLGLSEVDVGLAALIIQVEMPFLIIIGWIFYSERFGMKTTFGLLITLIGSVLILYKPHMDANISILGITALIISALSWAIGSARLKYIRELNFPTMIGFAFLMALPFSVLFSFMFESNQIEILQTADHLKLGGVLFYQVIIISVSHYWWKIIIGRNPIYMVTPFTILSTLFAVLFGIIFMNEALSTFTLIGAAVALTGIAIVTFRKAKKIGIPLESTSL